MLFNLTQQANVEQRSQVEDPRARGFVYSCYRRDYLRTTVGAPARIFGDDFSLGD